MNKYKFQLICVEGGVGWGETGQTGWIIVEAENIRKAIDNVEKTIPGGWKWFYETVVDPFELPRLHLDLEKRPKLKEGMWRELKICLVDPINDKGVYDPKNAPTLDYIVVSLYDDGLMLSKALLSEVTALMSRNGLYPED